MVKRNFEQWLYEQVEIEFGIERDKNLSTLHQWLNIDQPLENIPPTIEKLRASLADNVENWNEDELKMLFIAPFLIEFGFNNPPHYRVFTQRYMKIETDTVEAAGKVEWMVALGKQIPRNPFFFLHEYKPEKNSGNDPLGQLLIAMINAQMLNKSLEKELYGCYNLGRFWFFVVLENKKYSVSRAYDSTQEDDLKDIVVIFQRVKNHIHRELGLSEE